MDERALPLMIGGSMTAEIIAIVMVGVALAGVILASARWLRQDVARLESRLETQINALRVEIGKLRERMAHLEGLLEGLREAITGRVSAAS